MGRAVLLEHVHPDGSAHFDWMIQRSDGAGLISYRVSRRIDLPGVPRFEAQRLPDHRVVYLDYEGDLSGNRGRVTRVAVGELTVIRDADDGFECRGRLGGVTAVFRGVRQVGGWTFEVTAAG